jgi:3,4-dihydroxy 2-butanone 4-phosphate synthase
MSHPEVESALEALRGGRFVLIYDSDKRERETDLVIPSQFVTPAAIRRMRKDGGGLICTTVPARAWKLLGIPYLSDLFHEARDSHPLLAELIPNDIPYDTKSAFALTINHRKTFTGVTDRDRALTVSSFAGMVREAVESESGEEILRQTFGQLFRAPGHVTLLNASEGLLSKRSGHTEMATALVTLAGLIPSATICEMMGDDGKALRKSDAAEYARTNGLVFIEGAAIKSYWETRTGEKAMPDVRRAGVCANGR